MLILDTHALVWLTEGSERLGETSRKIINEHLQQQTLAVSAISFWEIAMLEIKGRLNMRQTVENWRTDLLSNGLHEVVVDGEIGVQAAHLEDFHGDPADRIITATTLNLGARICTADKGIIDWIPSSSLVDARK